MRLILYVSRYDLENELWCKGLKNFRCLEELIPMDISHNYDPLMEYLEELGDDLDSNSWDLESLNDYLCLDIDEILDRFEISNDKFDETLNKISD